MGRREKRERQGSKNDIQIKLNLTGNWALCLFLNDIKTDNLTRYERVKDIFIGIQIPPINAGCVDDFDPGRVDAKDFLYFSRKTVLTG